MGTSIFSIGWLAGLVTGEEKPSIDISTYITSQKCRICHRGVYTPYRKTKHTKVRAASTAPPAEKYRRSTAFDGERWTEPGVGCEACHGPGSLHAQASKKERASTILNPKDLEPSRRAEICGQCHARGRTPDGRDYPWQYLPGNSLTDSFSLAPPEPGDPFSVYTEWIRSKHSGEEVTCTTCHEPHGIVPEGVRHQLRKPTNELCGGCHRGEADIGEHQPRAPRNATCATCHMPDGSHAFTKRVARAEAED